MQKSDDFLLHFRLKINQQIATDDEIEPGKGRVGYQVLAGKGDGLAQLLANLMGRVAHAREEAREAFGGDVGGDVLRVDGLAGDFQGGFIDVRGEDLHGAVFVSRRDLFQ